MSYKEEDIRYEAGPYFVLLAKKGDYIYHEVYKNGITHATRVAQIGYGEIEGLKKSIEFIERRLLTGTKE